RASVAELQVDLGALDLHSRVQVCQLGLPRHGVRKFDAGERLTIPLRCGSLESSEGVEIMGGRSLGEGGAGAAFEVPCVDGLRGEVESVAAGRIDEDTVAELSAQSVDLDVQAREGTLGPIAWPQCFDHERGRCPHSQPENQHRQKRSLRASLYTAGDIIVEDLHAPHHAHKHPVRVVVALKTRKIATNLTSAPA